MRKAVVALGIIISIITSSCGTPIYFIGTVESKTMAEAWTEHIPAGYRHDCYISFEGRYECGYKLFHAKTEYHAAEYVLHISGDGCKFDYFVDETTYSKYDNGDRIELTLAEFQLGDCAPRQ